MGFHLKSPRMGVPQRVYHSVDRLLGDGADVQVSIVEQGEELKTKRPIRAKFPTGSEEGDNKQTCSIETVSDFEKSAGEVLAAVAGVTRTSAIVEQCCIFSRRALRHFRAISEVNKPCQLS